MEGTVYIESGRTSQGNIEKIKIDLLHWTSIVIDVWYFAVVAFLLHCPFELVTVSH